MVITHFGKIKQRQGEEEYNSTVKKDIVCFQDTDSSEVNDLEIGRAHV